MPVFWYRHYVQDKGVFPEHMLSDLGLSQADLKQRKAGILPYVTLVAGLIVVLVADQVFRLPG